MSGLSIYAVLTEDCNMLSYLNIKEFADLCEIGKEIIYCYEYHNCYLQSGIWFGKDILERLSPICRVNEFKTNSNHENAIRETALNEIWKQVEEMVGV